jgi:hypothetical protein
VDTGRLEGDTVLHLFKVRANISVNEVPLAISVLLTLILLQPSIKGHYNSGGRREGTSHLRIWNRNQQLYERGHAVDNTLKIADIDIATTNGSLADTEHFEGDPVFCLTVIQANNSVKQARLWIVQTEDWWHWHCYHQQSISRRWWLLILILLPPTDH